MAFTKDHLLTLELKRKTSFAMESGRGGRENLLHRFDSISKMSRVGFKKGLGK